MNLKIISSKVIATLVAIYLVIGNCAVAGLGIAEIIAEDIQTPQVAVLWLRRRPRRRKLLERRAPSVARVRFLTERY